MADLEICSRIEQRSVIKVLVAEQCKPSEIFRRMSAVYEEACFSQKMCTNGLNYGSHSNSVQYIFHLHPSV